MMVIILKVREIRVIALLMQVLLSLGVVKQEGIERINRKVVNGVLRLHIIRGV